MIRLAAVCLGGCALAAGAAGLAAQAVPTATQTLKPPAHKAPAPAPAHMDPAERAFQANCNRCHSAPETLSPRITGTVVRHMRVRANLSAEEERLILSYLNP
jgi:cytochrome c5